MTSAEFSALGFALRRFQSSDLGFICDSYRKSGLTRFLKGEFQPFPKFETTIKTALRKNNTALLTRIYQSEIGHIINSDLHEILIACDQKNLNTIYAWESRRFIYVKNLFRGIGLEDFLKSIYGS